MRGQLLAVWVVAFWLGACGAKQGASPGLGHQDAANSAKLNLPRPTAPMGKQEAERYILALINRDRAKHGFTALEWDAVAAKAGERHAKDMAQDGFTAHWGSDGSVPEQRYTESGGMDFSAENAGCFADAKRRELDPAPQFEASEIERVESAFLNEKPPHDGHRRNILRAWHTHVGVGLAKVKGLPNICMAQEFVDRYGVYQPLTKASANRLHVAGEIRSPASFVGVGVAKIGVPQKRSATFLLTTGSYAIPAPDTTYFPKGFVSPIPVSVEGNRFSVDVPIGKDSGIFEISIWGRVPGTKDNVMVSLRTLKVP